jgi:hypothetical protein
MRRRPTAQIDEKLAGVGRSVLAEQSGGPTIELGVRGQRGDERRQVGPIFRAVRKRIGLGKILDIGFMEIGRRVVEMNGAFEAKLRGPVRETGARDMIAARCSIRSATAI